MIFILHWPIGLKESLAYIKFTGTSIKCDLLAKLKLEFGESLSSLAKLANGYIVLVQAQILF